MSNMGVTVRKVPLVKLFDGWLDERTYFESGKPPIKVLGIFKLIYSMLSKHTYNKIDNETIEEYNDK
eukprot:545600-Ditylum_brightwellii.AAC.1